MALALNGGLERKKEKRNTRERRCEGERERGEKQEVRTGERS